MPGLIVCSPLASSSAFAKYAESRKGAAVRIAPATKENTQIRVVLAIAPAYLFCPLTARREFREGGGGSVGVPSF